MTAPTPPVAPVVIVPVSGSRLEALAEAYPSARAAADEAKAHLDQIVDGLKYELTMNAPGADRIDLAAPSLTAPLRLQSRTTRRFDSGKFKAENPAEYDRYLKQTSYWELRAVAPGSA